jgi:uncharacterized tellurite resistance protein B-like protein
MLWLSNSTLSRLRDQLRTRGARPSIVPGLNPGLAAARADALATELWPLMRAMYVMMTSDGQVANAEQEVLRGALKTLSDDRISGESADTLLIRAQTYVREYGVAATLRDVAGELRDDPERGEIAFVLCAAVAFADHTIADQENDTLQMFAECLGISEERGNLLLDVLGAERLASNVSKS